MKTGKPKLKQQQFAFNDAKLAVDIAAIRDQVSQLCALLRYITLDKPQAVLVLLSDAQRILGDALGVALTVEES